jgi:hypothetical protein
MHQEKKSQEDVSFLQVTNKVQDAVKTSLKSSTTITNDNHGAPATPLWHLITLNIGLLNGG